MQQPQIKNKVIIQIITVHCNLTIPSFMVPITRMGLIQNDLNRTSLHSVQIESSSVRYVQITDPPHSLNCQVIYTRQKAKYKIHILSSLVKMHHSSLSFFSTSIIIQRVELLQHRSELRCSDSSQRIPTIGGIECNIIIHRASLIVSLVHVVEIVIERFLGIIDRVQ